ncbi:putative metallopeptidase [Sorangium cellulosum So ce56]|uniref:Metallopeptidase n=1 Tax=Sorangium cellulosum (strain So ce56) TaxID=448385 RepID=A9G260_SORC5|nr:M1 family metallopeptidase [Sorangium cellulosum]CAN92581.1 putative metallopeptidase [Sorangium cellulosum So ce56]
MRTALQAAVGLLLALLAGRMGASLLATFQPIEPDAPARRSPAAPSGASAAPAPAAPAPAPRPDAELAAHADPIASYTLRASLDPAQHTMHGEGTLVWRNASREPQRELFVHLYLNAFKDPRTVFLRSSIDGFRGGEMLYDYGHIQVTRFAVREMEGADVWPRGKPTTPGDPDDETDIRVELPRAVAPGEAITIDLAWDADLPSLALRTGHHGSFHMVGQWFPKIARLEPDGRWAHFPYHRLSEFYADFGAYDVTVDVPERFVVGATGRLVEERRADGRAIRRFVQEDVHDFAFAAWDRFRELRATTGDGVAIRCLFPEGSEREAALEIDLVRFGLERFGAAFGRYPYGTLTIVHPPEGAEEAGGMEYPTLITTGGSWLWPAVGVRFVEAVTVHELAHQWFYGLVATNEHRYPFLDEGLTTYAEADALRARYGDGSWARLLGLEIDLRAQYRADALRSGHNGAVAQPAAGFVDGKDYLGLVYGRPAVLLATLEGVYGEDLVRRAVGRYARENRFRHPGPEALLDAVRREVGDEAAEALRAGLFERAWVDYTVEAFDAWPADTAAPAPGEAGIEAAGYRGRAVVRRRGSLVLPVEVALHGEDGSVQRARWDARESTAAIPYAGASPLAAVVIDPDHRVLLDEDLANNARRSRPDLLAPGVLSRASFAVGLALTLLGP